MTSRKDPETSSETVRGSDRWWLALMVRDSVIWGEGQCMENRPPGLNATACGGHTEILLKGKSRQDLRLGRDPGHT